MDAFGVHRGSYMFLVNKKVTANVRSYEGQMSLLHHLEISGFVQIGGQRRCHVVDLHIWQWVCTAGHHF